MIVASIRLVGLMSNAPGKCYRQKYDVCMFIAHIDTHATKGKKGTISQISDQVNQASLTIMDHIDHWLTFNEMYKRLWIDFVPWLTYFARIVNTWQYFKNSQKAKSKPTLKETYGNRDMFQTSSIQITGTDWFIQAKIFWKKYSKILWISVTYCIFVYTEYLTPCL